MRTLTYADFHARMEQGTLVVFAPAHGPDGSPRLEWLAVKPDAIGEENTYSPDAHVRVGQACGLIDGLRKYAASQGCIVT